MATQNFQALDSVGHTDHLLIPLSRYYNYTNGHPKVGRKNTQMKIKIRSYGILKPCCKGVALAHIGEGAYLLVLKPEDTLSFHIKNLASL